MQVEQGKYGATKDVFFELFEVDGIDLRTDWTPAAADCQVSTDGGAFGNSDNIAVVAPTGTGVYKVVLSATEMTGAIVIIKLVDAATKVFLDRVIKVETYGNASAQHAFDLDTASTPQTGDTYDLLTNDGDVAINTLTIDATTGNALTIVSNGGGGSGIDITGHGTGPGINILGGASGDGVTVLGRGIGASLSLTAGPTGHGIEVIGGNGPVGPFDGINVTAGTAGTDIRGDITGTIDTVTNVTNGATAAKLLAYTQLLARSDAAIATDNATEQTEINANGGSGSGNYSNTTEAQEALRDNTGTDGAGLTNIGTIATVTDVTNDVGITAQAVTDMWNKAATDLAGPPTSTDTMLNVLSWFLMLSRNTITTNGTDNEVQVANNAGAVIADADISDDGTDFVRTKFTAPD